MIHPLVRKELREHLWVLIVMWILCGLAGLMMLVKAKTQGSPLEAFRQLIIFGTLLSLALANRFVVREYGGRTQLFLETLPMSRAQVIAIKWLTSTACLLLPMAVGFGIILLVAADKVELTSRFITIMALRAGVFLLFFHALAFLIGLMGRYRYLLWLGLLLLAVISATQGQQPATQWPPLLLIGNSLAFERETMPWSALWITTGAAAVLIGAAFALALGFQGSWVVALSRRMTLREKVIAAAVLLSVVYGVNVIDSRKVKAPFALQNAMSSPEGAPAVKVARATGLSDERASQLALRLSGDIADARDYLAMKELPAVAVLPDVAVDADQFLVAKLPTSDGVVVRAAAGSEQFDESAFRAFTVARVIDWHSRNRASHEQNRWLLDGFSAWRNSRDDAGRRELLTVRAAAAADAIDRGGGTPGHALQQWFRTREELGECLADALAWRATEQLSQFLGSEGFRGFVRARLGARSYSGVHDFLTSKSMEEQLGDADASLKVFEFQLENVLRTERQKYSERIDTIPRWPVSFDAVPMQGSTFEVRYAMSVPEKGTAFAVRYKNLGPWDGEVPRFDLEREDAVGPGVLPASFPRGTRLLTAVEVQDPALGCAVRLGSRRWEVR